MTFKKLLCVGFWFALVAQTSLAMQTPQTSLQDIQHLRFDDQYDELLVGEQSVPIIVNEANTPITRGVAILLSEAGHNPFSLQGLHNLSRSLNDVGWVTITLPSPVSGLMPRQEEQQVQDESKTDQPEPPNEQQASLTMPNARSGNSQLNEQAFLEHEQQIILTMQAVVQRSSQYPGFFLVIGQGTSAAWLTKIYAQNKLGNPDALVVLSPHWPDRDYNLQLPQWTAQTQMPVLDLYSPWDSAWARETVEQRRIQSIKALKMVYRQRELTGQAMDQEQFMRMGKEIYGWLTHMGW